MKKIFITLFILTILTLGALSKSSVGFAHIYVDKSASIEDELVKSADFPKVMPKFVNTNEPIIDELVVPYEKSGVTLKLWARKNDKKNSDINDELINPNFVEKFGGKSLLTRKYQRIEDNFVKHNISNRKLAKIKIKNNYDFTQAQIPVQLKIIKNLTTKSHILEGDEILFKTTKDVSLNGEILPKGTQIVGRVETVSESDKMGCPANIIVDNFHVKDNPDICFYGNITKTGANRSIWVYPLYQAGNIMFYVAGFVFVPIHGGHAKLLTNDTFTVFYETGARANNLNLEPIQN